MNEKDFAELSAGHALGALSLEDEQTYLAALADHPEWAAAAAEDELTAASLGDGVPEEAPPADLRATLLARIADLPQTPAGAADDAAPPTPARPTPAADWSRLAIPPKPALPFVDDPSARVRSVYEPFPAIPVPTDAGVSDAGATEAGDSAARAMDASADADATDADADVETRVVELSDADLETRVVDVPTAEPDALAADAPHEPTPIEASLLAAAAASEQADADRRAEAQRVAAQQAAARAEAERIEDAQASAGDVPSDDARVAAAPEAAEPVSSDEADRAVTPPPSTEVIQTIQRRNWTRGLFALVASVVLLVGLGWGVGSIVERARTPLSVQALDQIEAAPDAQTVTGQFVEGGEAVVHWSAELGKAVLTTGDVPEIPGDRTFQLWFVRGDTATSAGTFEPEDEVTALLDGPLEAGDVVAITVEADGGSPEGAPTTEPIIAIPTDSEQAP